MSFNNEQFEENFNGEELLEEDFGEVDFVAEVTPVEVSKRVMGEMKKPDPDNDPTVVRWGYNPGQRNIPNQPLKTGIEGMFIPFGKFFAHTSFHTPRENCTIDEFKPTEYLATVTALEGQQEVEAALKDWGYQSFFYGVDDANYVTAIEAVLLPSLSQIRKLCGKYSPIPKECPAVDEFDLAEPREYCPTCHLMWIKSEALNEFIAEAARSGIPVRWRDESGFHEERIYPKHEDLDNVRKIVQISLETYIRKASTDWATIVSELDNKTRTRLNDSEHYLRKDLHASKPQNKEADMVVNMARANAENTNEFVAELTENNRLMQEQLAQNNQMFLNQQKQTTELLQILTSALTGQPLPNIANSSAETQVQPQGGKTPKGKTGEGK